MQNYVKYDTGIEGIGDNRDGIVLFRVLYNDDTNGLQIISDKNVEQVTLGGSNWVTGRDSYNSAIATLNQKAERYAISSPYALDGRCVGSVPNNANYDYVSMIYNSSYWFSNYNGKIKDENDNIDIDFDQMDSLGIAGIGVDYWMASRKVDITSKAVQINPRGVTDFGGKLSSCIIEIGQTNGARSASYYQGFRPVFTLKATIKVTGGNGTSSSPYTLGT